MYPRSARLYDLIYTHKNYAFEALILHRFISDYKQSPGNTVLDVGCGTGRHMAFLRRYDYKVEGLDLDPYLVAVAREQHPDIPFHHGDMVSFDLGRQFDLVTCLFSAIGYVRTVPRLRQAVATMSRHLLPGGVLIVEPWFTPETIQTIRFVPEFVHQSDLSIARMAVHTLDDAGSVLTFHYMVGTAMGVEYFTERHELGLFTHDDYVGAFEAAGLQVWRDKVGLGDRGLYIGRRAGAQAKKRSKNTKMVIYYQHGEERTTKTTILDRPDGQTVGQDRAPCAARAQWHLQRRTPCQVLPSGDTQRHLLCDQERYPLAIDAS